MQQSADCREHPAHRAQSEQWGGGGRERTRRPIIGRHKSSAHGGEMCIFHTGVVTWDSSCCTVEGCALCVCDGGGVLPRGRETKEWEGGNSVSFNYCFRTAVLKEQTATKWRVKVNRRELLEQFAVTSGCILRSLPEWLKPRASRASSVGKLSTHLIK